MCRAPAFKQGLNLTKQLQLRSALVRNYAEDSREAMARAARRRATLKERAMAPAGPTGKLSYLSAFLDLKIYCLQHSMLVLELWQVVLFWVLVLYVITVFHTDLAAVL